MTARLIDGKQLAADMRQACAATVKTLIEKGIAPCLVVIRVGDDPASESYVRGKIKACAEVGMRSEHIHLPTDTTPSALMDTVTRCNLDPSIHGILVQLPLPRHLDSEAVIAAIDPSKDADGFHTINAGLLAQGQTHQAIVPCTPAGIMHMLAHTGITIAGQQAVVVGRSNIVGKPIALLLLQKNATVTICHSKTAHLAEHIGRADIVIGAVGQPQMIRGEWIKQGATVIDVGINRQSDGRLVGDVEFAVAKERAAWITPVPGGVGPMTIAMLIANTLQLAKKLAERHTSY